MEEGNNSNCIFFSPQRFPESSWEEWDCNGENIGCPCSFDNQPNLVLRGACPGSDLEMVRYTPKQLFNDPSEIFLVGAQNSQIRFQKNISQWVLKSPSRRVVAVSSGSQSSYVLGTQNWTISGDNPACTLDGAPYNREMKLTACGLDKFTCSTGKCIDIEQRCNQVEDCHGLMNDKSDESVCKNIIL